MKIERHETGPRMRQAVIKVTLSISLASLQIARKARAWPSRLEASCRRLMAF